MAATMKHRRSARRRKTTRGAERYDVVLRKFKKIKKFGGSFLVKSKVSKKLVPPHKASKNNAVYNTVKVLKEE